jgi:hypothetical protein
MQKRIPDKIVVKKLKTKTKGIIGVAFFGFILLTSTVLYAVN